MGMEYYDVLEVGPDASAEQIWSSYKVLLGRYDPRVYEGGSSAARKKIRELDRAFYFLSDMDRRARYDKKLQVRSGVAGKGKPGGTPVASEDFKFYQVVIAVLIPYVLIFCLPWIIEGMSSSQPREAGPVVDSAFVLKVVQEVAGEYGLVQGRTSSQSYGYLYRFSSDECDLQVRVYSNYVKAREDFQGDYVKGVYVLDSGYAFGMELYHHYSIVSIRSRPGDRVVAEGIMNVVKERLK